MRNSKSPRPIILVIDDDPRLCKSLSDILKAKGYPSVIASSGQAALEIVKENRPAVALVDLKLGDMSGLETIKIIKTISPRTECIVLTGYASQESAIEAINLGAYNYLQKPYDLDRLLLTIRRAMEKQEAEEALWESEKKYRQLAENCIIGIVIGSLDGELIYANSAILGILGVNRIEDILSRPLKQWLAPPSYALLKEEMKKRLGREAVPDVLHLNVVRPDGKSRMLEISRHEILSEGRILVQSLIADVTDRKRMEEEVLRTSKLESLSLLAGGIAHDFNNILTGIMANISIARHLIKPGEEALEPIMDAEQASIRARDLVRQLLLFARGGNQSRESTSLADLLREVTGFVLAGSNVASRFIMADDLWPIEADTGQIYQVFENLVINAKQAMNKGGLLEIRGENLVVGEESAPALKPGRYVRMSVKDEGEGIPEHNLARIFDPYFTTKEEGSGLGLAVTFSIIKNHGGHIDVESRVGEGTTFEIYLPALWSDEEARAGMTGGRDGRTGNGKGRILVMDDEESIRKTLGRLLGFMDYRVDFAVCGEEAIEMYRKARDDGKNYQAAIMDLTVPGKMGGREAAGIIKGIDPEARLIVSSGYSNDDLMANYQNYGFISVMVKPYTVKELQETLEKVINKN